MGRVIKGWGPGALAAEPAAPEVTPAGPPPTVAAEVEREVAAALQAAHRDGFEAGHAEALAQAAGILADAQAEAERALEATAPAALALASRMAEKIVGRAVALQPDLVAEIVTEALAGCRPGEAAVRIRVHPDHLAAVEARRERLAGPGRPRIHLTADETVGRYGCVIDTARGRIDGRLPAQLAALERAVRGDGPGGRDG